MAFFGSSVLFNSFVKQSWNETLNFLSILEMTLSKWFVIFIELIWFVGESYWGNAAFLKGNKRRALNPLPWFYCISLPFNANLHPMLAFHLMCWTSVIFTSKCTWNVRIYLGLVNVSHVHSSMTSSLPWKAHCYDCWVFLLCLMAPVFSNVWNSEQWTW